MDALVGQGESERDATRSCVLGETFAPTLVAGLAGEYPGRYSDEVLACIGDAFSALGPEEVAAVTRAGLFGEGEDDANSVVSGLFEGCGVEPPEEGP